MAAEPMHSEECSAISFAERQSKKLSVMAGNTFRTTDSAIPPQRITHASSRKNPDSLTASRGLRGSITSSAYLDPRIRKLIGKLGAVEQLRACYEAGPTGYVLYWQLTELGVECAVIAPTLVPVKAGDRVKTDRRDATKLARCHRAGDLTPARVPDAGSEALRDLVWAREVAKQDQLRARHRLSKFLLRTGQRPAAGMKAWTLGYMAWVRQLRFQQVAQESTRLDYLPEVEHMAERVKRLEQAITEAVKLASAALQEVIRGLQALRGVAQISAVTIAAELGNISRFNTPRQLMGYSGVVPSEDSSGQRTRRGSITKSGNAHLRRIAIEAAWSYRLRPGVGPALRKRQEGVAEEIKEIAWKAQHRLHKRYCRLAAAGKDQRKIITAVGRELLGFIWAIGIKAEAIGKLRMAA